LVGQAIPSYGPKHGAAFVKKLECFCFKQQALAAGESRQMPVQFVIDPALPASVTTLTLSYTFFEVPAADTKKTSDAAVAAGKAG
jgi:cytochrome c oxidase assembly protein subunit 11